jgi:SpoVK/Ycf46/Vps4 family AAA+-type ATPase
VAGRRPLWLRALTYDGTGFLPIPYDRPLPADHRHLLHPAARPGRRPAGDERPLPARDVPPEQITTSLDDVVGIDGIKDDVVRSLNLFLAHAAFRDEMGGTPRRGLLFEGRPGHRQDPPGPAMAREAGVPFLFVSATSFQSMWLRRDRQEDPLLLQGAAQGRPQGGRRRSASSRRSTRSPMCARRREPGMTPVSPWSRCPDAAAGARRPPPSRRRRRRARARQKTSLSEGTGGVVNEMLVQMQSFDDPPGASGLRLVRRPHQPAAADRTASSSAPTSSRPTLLLIAATNRATARPALLLPPSFDRRLTFEAAGEDGRRASSTTS